MENNIYIYIYIYKGKALGLHMLPYTGEYGQDQLNEFGGSRRKL